MITNAISVDFFSPQPIKLVAGHAYWNITVMSWLGANITNVTVLMATMETVTFAWVR